jgi:protein-tyrosine phosphatase
MDENSKVSVLFLCMGNICRSPAAHGVMETLVEQKGLADRIMVDSAGTLDYHEGELPDARMREAAARRGVDLTHRSRPLTARDFHSFDYLVAMDHQNLMDLEEFRPHGKSRAEVSLLMSHCDTPAMDEVPDPYLGGRAAFEQVLDLVDQGCGALLKTIRQRHGLR